MRTWEKGREGAGPKLMGAKGKGRRNGSWRSEVDKNRPRDIQRGKERREGRGLLERRLSAINASV